MEKVKQILSSRDNDKVVVENGVGAQDELIPDDPLPQAAPRKKKSAFYAE